MTEVPWVHSGTAANANDGVPPQRPAGAQRRMCLAWLSPSPPSDGGEGRGEEAPLRRPPPQPSPLVTRGGREANVTAAKQLPISGLRRGRPHASTNESEETTARAVTLFC